MGTLTKMQANVDTKSLGSNNQNRNLITNTFRKRKLRVFFHIIMYNSMEWKSEVVKRGSRHRTQQVESIKANEC